MPSDHRSHASDAPAHNRKTLGERLQVIADHQWKTVQEEDKQNEELLDLSRQILTLTKEVRALAGPPGSGGLSHASD